ncbi:hypothetical protein PMAYCL1PPCAC_08176, partial [Pristionchus mayeri]
FRSRILSSLHQQSGKLSEKSRKMHGKFVSTLPFVQVIAVLTFFLGFFDIFHHPAVESSTTMWSLESFIVAIHFSIATLSISLTLLLLFVVFRHTPKQFSTFGIMIKFHAFFDFYDALGGSTEMLRALPTFWSFCMPIFWFDEARRRLLLGVIGLFSSFTVNFQSLTILASFVFRLMTVQGNTPTRAHAIGLLSLTLPIPIIIMVSSF